jgi:murein DD-endopeptidase MepM/ murein hydrolase activator NlpD
MASAFSDTTARSSQAVRWRKRTWPLLLLGLLMPLAPLRVQAENPWLRGQFPVATFQAYTSHYGLRDGPSGDPESHNGLDIAAPLGSPVRSWWGGRIAEVIVDRRCGIGLVVRSGAWEHMYCHLGGSVRDGLYRAEGVLIGPGQRVRRGELIGRIGMTGRTTGPHLHWALRYDGRWLDPALILRAMAHARRQLAPNVRPEPRVDLFR